MLKQKSVLSVYWKTSKQLGTFCYVHPYNETSIASYTLAKFNLKCLVTNFCQNKKYG